MFIVADLVSLTDGLKNKSMSTLKYSINWSYIYISDAGTWMKTDTCG